MCLNRGLAMDNFILRHDAKGLVNSFMGLTSVYMLGGAGFFYAIFV